MSCSLGPVFLPCCLALALPSRRPLLLQPSMVSALAPALTDCGLLSAPAGLAAGALVVVGDLETATLGSLEGGTDLLKVCWLWRSPSSSTSLMKASTSLMELSIWLAGEAPRTLAATSSPLAASGLAAGGDKEGQEQAQEQQQEDGQEEQLE